MLLSDKTFFPYGVKNIYFFDVFGSAILYKNIVNRRILGKRKYCFLKSFSSMADSQSSLKLVCGLISVRLVVFQAAEFNDRFQIEF